VTPREVYASLRNSHNPNVQCHAISLAIRAIHIINNDVYRFSELGSATSVYTTVTDGIGQIEHLSQISSITPQESSTGFTFTISKAAPILVDCNIGDSICVNGACLTVTEFEGDWFKVGLANETLTRTNLGKSWRVRRRDGERVERRGN
jgi:hypothetical protein